MSRALVKSFIDPTSSSIVQWNKKEKKRNGKKRHVNRKVRVRSMRIFGNQMEIALKGAGF